VYTGKNLSVALTEKAFGIRIFLACAGLIEAPPIAVIANPENSPALAYRSELRFLGH